MVSIGLASYFIMFTNFYLVNSIILLDTLYLVTNNNFLILTFIDIS